MTRRIDALFLNDKPEPDVMEDDKSTENVEDLICPVCGYYCLGNGGIGCIDKKGLYEILKEPSQ